MQLRRRDVALAQGLYYAVTGVWPLVSRRSFEAVTGRKTDWWLVQTFSLTLLPIGAALSLAAARDEVTPELELLGAGAAGVLAGTDVAIATPPPRPPDVPDRRRGERRDRRGLGARPSRGTRRRLTTYIAPRSALQDLERHTV